MLDIEDNISLTYEELETVSKQEWNKLEREARQQKVRLSLLRENIIMLESESTSSVQSKYKA